MPQLGVSADTVINAILSCSLAFITLQGDTFFIVLGQQRHILITVYVTNHIAFYVMLSFLFHQFPRKLGQWPSLFKNLSAQESSRNPLARSAFFVFVLTEYKFLSYQLYLVAHFSRIVPSLWAFWVMIQPWVFQRPVNKQNDAHIKVRGSAGYREQEQVTLSPRSAS